MVSVFPHVREVGCEGIDDSRKILHDSEWFNMVRHEADKKAEGIQGGVKWQGVEFENERNNCK